MFENQEEYASHAFDIADMGGAVTVEQLNISDEPDALYEPFTYTPPVVSLGPSFPTVASQIGNINLRSIAAGSERWREMSALAEQSGTELERMAQYLAENNESDATDAAVRRILESARGARRFQSHADVLAAKLGAMHGSLAMMVPQAALDAAMLALIEPEKRPPIEKALLASYQTALQSVVDTSLPTITTLMDPVEASGGGEVTVGMDDVAGSGSRYTTDRVQWPEAITDLMERGELGPGSFNLVNGELQGLQGVGAMPAADLAQLRDLAAQRSDYLQQLGNLHSINPGALSTYSAGTNVATQGSGLSMPGLPGATMGTPAGVGASPSIGSASGIGSAGTLGNISSTGSGLGNTPFAPMGPLGSRTPAYSALGPGVGTGLGSGPGAGLGQAGAGRAGAPGLGAGGAVRGAFGGGIGSSVGSGLGAGSGGMTRGGLSPSLGSGAGGTTSAVAGAAGTGSGAQAQGQRGMMGGPMMGAGARGAEETKAKRSKIVSSAAERDRNRRDLLGDAPEVVPGVIGDWARY